MKAITTDSFIRSGFNTFAGLLILNLTLLHNVNGQTFSKGSNITTTNFINGTSAWGDFDNDGDLDLILIGTPDNTSLTQLFSNNGDGTFVEISGHNIINVGNGDVALEDYDRDGWLDVMVSGISDTDAYETRLYRNNGDNTFAEVEFSFFGLNDSSVNWVDFNNDGKIDVMITGQGESFHVVRLYKNLDGDQFEEVEAPFDAVSQCDVEWADFDNDGNMDIAIAGYSGSNGLTRIYRNKGDETFEFHQELTVAMRASIDWGDYNNDGHLDLVVSGFSGSHQTLIVYKNDNGNFIEIIDDDFIGGEQGNTAWIDYDNDGNLDIISSLIGGGTWGTRVFHNDGDDQFSLDSESGMPADFSDLSLVDIDQDGDLDLFFPSTFNSDNATSFYINGNPNENILPVIPILNDPQINENTITISWETSFDTGTSKHPTYNIFLTHQGDTIVSPNSLKNGIRKIVGRGNKQYALSHEIMDYQPGDYTYSVQAIDNSFNASGFANTKSFHINFPPVVTTLIEPINILEESTTIISVELFTIEDPDHVYPDDFTITILAGENYSVSSNQLIPDEDFNGTLTVGLRVSDGADESEVFEFPLEVSPVNDKPKILGASKTLTTIEGTSLSLSVSDLLIDDPDNTDEDFSLTILEGSNYSFSQNVITPNDDFIGTLNVSIIVNDGIDDSEPFTIPVIVTEILATDRNLKELLHIYPNPTTSYIDFKAGIYSNQKIQINIFSIAGELVRDEKVSSLDNLRIDIRDLLSGVYIIEIKGVGFSEKVRIIKK